MEKRYEHQTAEPNLQKQWETEQTYTTANNPGPLFSIDTPPPTVSGRLHIGHIFSYTQTDIIARYKRMQGFSVLYPFGFDDNGLPTEKFVEKTLKVRAHTMKRSEFIALCLQETHKAEQQFKNLWQRMGLSADWSKCYSTISATTRKLSQESFLDLYKKGHIYRKYEPALYCTSCRTSVAQAELDDVEQASFFNDIVFKDAQGNNLLIGTTRPELLSSCVALLYNPTDKRYQHLKGTQATVPLFGNTVPILEDEAVSIEKGTGLVMCCTFGDKTDIEWFKKFNLPYKQSIGFDGKWLADTGILAGLNTHEARAKVLEELKINNLLVNQKPISHAVNVHERCKKEIEYVALSQWFLNILDHKQTFLELADQIDWHPHFMKARYKDWVQNISWDWCLSRQRMYGIPFPVWHCQDCNQVLLADTKTLPIDPQEVPYAGVCTKCGGSTIIPDKDVMDTWNTSSITPYIISQYVNGFEQSPFEQKEFDFLPMSMRPQAHDIIRTWAFYTIVKTWMHHGVIPWKDIVISGHVLSDAQQKLSKSQGGGGLDPEKLLELYAADVIRYWTASGSLGQDVAFSENQLKIGQKLSTKLWNAFRFAQEHALAPTSAPANLGPVNEWLLHAATQCFEQYSKYFEQNEFGLALAHVERFFWHDFCDNYLELIKNQLFNPDQYDATAVAATRQTLHLVGLRILQMFGPYMPHITESLYEMIYKPQLQIGSLHQTKFESVQTPYHFEQSAANVAELIEVVGRIRKLKSEKQLSLKTAIATLTVHAKTAELAKALQEQDQIIRGVAQAEKVAYVVGELEVPTIQDVNGTWQARV